METKLLGHLLKVNDPETTREIEQLLVDDPSAIHDLAQLRRALAPLEATRDEIEPPTDLWVRTIARVAENIVATEGGVSAVDAGRTEELIRRAAAMAAPTNIAPTARRAAPVSEALPTTPRRRNVFAIIGLSAAALALVFPAVIHVRQAQQRSACQNSMLQFYQAAASYSDNNDGQFPRVEDGKPATTVADTLKLKGYLPADQRFVCPAHAAEPVTPASLVNYAYTLGFREGNQLQGVDRYTEAASMPILADAPIRQGNLAIPGNHRHGHNVLFADGNVRFCTDSHVGVNRDDIFYSTDVKVKAGNSRTDTVLGRPEEVP